MQRSIVLILGVCAILGVTACGSSTTGSKQAERSVGLKIFIPTIKAPKEPLPTVTSLPCDRTCQQAVLTTKSLQAPTFARMLTQVLAMDQIVTSSLKLEAAYDAMVRADDHGIKGQDALGARAESQGIAQRITAREKFDAAIEAVSFPRSCRSDARTVLSDDASLERALRDLRANDGDVARFNGVLRIVEKADRQFRLAITRLANEDGLTVSGG